MKFPHRQHTGPGRRRRRQRATLFLESQAGHQLQHTQAIGRSPTATDCLGHVGSYQDLGGLAHGMGAVFGTTHWGYPLVAIKPVESENGFPALPNPLF